MENENEETKPNTEIIKLSSGDITLRGLLRRNQPFQSLENFTIEPKTPKTRLLLSLCARFHRHL